MSVRPDDLTARRIELGGAEDEAEAMYERGWTDGLPVVAPTPERVARMLEGTTRDPGEVVAVVPPNLAPCTVEKVAINAVMAGCKPEYMPVVRGVLEAAWLAAPHPDIGAAWVASVAAPLARVKAVEDLTHRNANHPEARLLMARIALEAGLTGRARSELDALVGSGAADRRAYLLLATLEETEQGDTAEGRAAQTRWLREAAAATDAPRWRCDACGAEHGAWKPDCAACGATARINWSSPASLPALTQA